MIIISKEKIFSGNGQTLNFITSLRSRGKKQNTSFKSFRMVLFLWPVSNPRQSGGNLRMHTSGQFIRNATFSTTFSRSYQFASNILSDRNKTQKNLFQSLSRSFSDSGDKGPCSMHFQE